MILRKLTTALQLLGRLDGRTIRHRFNYNTGQWRIRRHGRQSFVYHDLGFPFVCHPDWPDSVEHFCTERNRLPGDAWEIDLVTRWLQPGDAVIDAGANLGFYTFRSAALVGSSGRVLAIDASPFVAAKLGASAQLLGLPQVVPLQLALTRTAGTVTFYTRPDRLVTATQSLAPSESEKLLSVPVEVPARTLVQLKEDLRAGSPLSLVKIDIEGAEGPALESVPPEWLGPDGPLWIAEINPESLARFGFSPENILAHFPPEHFQCWLLVKCPLGPLIGPALRAVTPDAAPDFSDSVYYNLVAIPRGGAWRSRRASISRQLPSPTT